MCQRLYIATREVLARVTKSRRTPFLAVAPAPEVPSGLRGHLQAECEHLSVAEAFAPCGCGFPEQSEARHGRVKKREPEARRTMEALVNVLRPVVKGRPRVQLYLSFEGQEHDEAPAERTVGIDDLSGEEFRFRNHEVLTVVRRGV